uniref:Uncharacterized protein n=1 Tax=Leersia perrieri TaxID=77586 RepID=A0A0D9WYI4_9ORYZ
MPKDTQGSSRDSELMPPTIHGKRSARPRGRNYTPWTPLQGLLNSIKKMKMYGNDESGSSKDMRSAEGDGMSSDSSENAHKLEENNGEDTKYKLLAIKTELTERIDPITRGKRSVRPRAKELALPASQDELQKVETGQNRRWDGLAVYTRKNKTISKGKEKSGTDNNAIKEVKNNTSAAANKKDGALSPDTPMESANALEPQPVAQAIDINHPMVDRNADSEAALASIYGEPSKWDLCITFAVKLLMDEMPLPEHAAEVEEFFRQKMNSANNTKAGRSVY